MTFSGNTDESAKIFFDTLIKTSTVYNKEIEKRIMTLNEKIENKVRGYASYSSIIQHIKDELKDIIK